MAIETRTTCRTVPVPCSLSPIPRGYTLVIPECALPARKLRLIDAEVNDRGPQEVWNHPNAPYLLTNGWEDVSGDGGVEVLGADLVEELLEPSDLVLLALVLDLDAGFIENFSVGKERGVHPHGKCHGVRRP